MFKIILWTVITIGNIYVYAWWSIKRAKNQSVRKSDIVLEATLAIIFGLVSFLPGDDLITRVMVALNTMIYLFAFVVDAITLKKIKNSKKR